ncbi:hypothetical protein SAMN05660337_0407 [Maridesulfovibrio ferrireducens]|uniref:Uncharacterized protein n=1 Tax=Maridesulfovibrio ferrireducens TaxID=246191 RepID=A0A1G9BTJ4_9BACT|nr:hypothetical protein [Maridesulfovibrio ferrireducens]SDK42504.1 hypothetical protein SAMN05660337_0407 [Maridesulfovibrio ferrireducens]
MKGKFSVIIAFFILLTATSAFAQDGCDNLLKTELTNIPGVQTTIQENGKFLTILATSDKAESIKIASRITALHSRTSSTGCDFNSFPIAVFNSNLLSVKTKTADNLSNADIEKLLYKHVYALSPVQVDENLKGYTRLAELFPLNSYYAARVEHYKERSDLQKTRNNFIKKCLREAAKDKNIRDLKINRDVYLFITDDDTPQKTSLAFLDKVEKITPRPKKELCLFFYDSELNRKGDSCPAEYQQNLGNTEETLLMNYVQSIPSYRIEQNINGYKALKKLNPASTLYTSKLDSYESKLRGLNNFLNIQTSSGEKLFLKNILRGSTLFVTLDDKAIEGKSRKSLKSFYSALNSYYAYSGSPYQRCMLKSQTGATLGKIQCTKNGRCRFKE